MNNKTQVASQRRYDLDWLRVLVFGLLILYHIGMFYVTWDFHVKSVHVGPTFEPVMKLLNPWRLSLLFFISGIAIRFAINKSNLASFTKRRTKILLIPIVFGMAVVVAPQAWLELLEKGETNLGFTGFYLQYLSASPDFSIIVPTWNHLWYVVYLLAYTLIIVPFARLLSTGMTGVGSKITNLLFRGRLGIIWLLVLPVAIFWIHYFVLKPIFPSTHALIDDWANHQLYFAIFIFGYLIAKDSMFWGAVERALVPAGLLVVSLSVISCVVWYLEFKASASDWYIFAEFWSERVRKTGFAWFSIVFLLSAAYHWLNKPSPLLSYMTEAIFSWYILHQTLIIVFGYWLTRQGLSFIGEFLLLVVSTYLACFLLHEFIIRRHRFTRPLFGMKNN